MPAADTVAVAATPKLFDHAYVPPTGEPVAVKVPEAPLQIVNVAGDIETLARALTVTTTFC